MATSTRAMLVSALFVCMLVAASYSEAAITCAQVTANLNPCLPYLEGTGPPTSGCCSGVAALGVLVKTASDKQDVYNCVNELAGSDGNKIDLNLAVALPDQCGLPFVLNFVG